MATKKPAAKKAAPKKKTLKIPADIADMMKAGVHFGHKKAKWNPRTAEFVFGIRSGIHIIDLEKTSDLLGEAMKVVSEAAKKGKKILVVGTKPQAREAIALAATEMKQPYVNNRWVGGTLTNFDSISKRLEYFRSLEKQKTSGELKKYTKKERHGFDVQLKRLESKYGGIKHLTSLPTYMFVLDARANKAAIDEAKKTGVEVIAIVDTNVDPTKIDFPIPANDDAISSIDYILNRLVSAWKKGK